MKKSDNIKTKRVLFLTNIPAPYRIDFFNELGRYTDLTVILETSKGLNRDRIWLSKKGVNFKSVFLNGLHFKLDSSISFKSIRHIKLFKNDTIVIGGYSTPTSIISIVYMKLFGIPYYLNADGGFIRNESFIKYKIKRFLIKGAKGYLSPSVNTDSYLKHYGAFNNRIHRYHFSSLYSKDILQRVCTIKDKNTLKTKYGINNKTVILAVGQFIYRKGFDVLIEVFNYLESDVFLCIIGGNVTNAYLDLINPTKINNIKFVNHLNKEVLFEYYRMSDIFVLPTREDIWGLVINEAMANGLPIITTNKCGAGLELVKDNGFIVNTNSKSDLTDKINRLIMDSSIREKMSSKSLDIINDYTIEQMVKDHLDIFSKGD